jgi:iron(III) transport system ATP-binding protein
MIEINNICKMYGTHWTVQDISFVIPDRARIAILGPSGSGKTTILRLIAGLEVPDRGTITFDGRIVSDPCVVAPPYERSLGFVFQSSALWPHMTVLQNILFPVDNFSDKTILLQIQGMMERMGIAHLKDRYPDQISGGEARRVALARALAPEPDTLLFDEPLTNIDYSLREGLLGLISETLRTSKSRMVYVTHDEHEARTLADTIIRLENGRIVGTETQEIHR